MHPGEARLDVVRRPLRQPSREADARVDRLGPAVEGAIGRGIARARIEVLGNAGILSVRTRAGPGAGAQGSGVMNHGRTLAARSRRASSFAMAG